MRRPPVLIIVALLSVLLSGPAAAQPDATIALAQPGVCYATLGKITPIPSALITIDITTGAGTLIGITGISGVGMFGGTAAPSLAIKSTGEMFSTDTGDQSNLYRIDAVTAAATVVGNTGLLAVGALAFDGNDVLYGVSRDEKLYIIDHVTAVPTLVGPVGGDVRGLAFDPTDGTLFGSGGGFVPLMDAIVTIDKFTGATTLIGYTGIGGATPDLHFDVFGNLYACKGGGGGGFNNLVSIEKTTGVATIIGNTGFQAVAGLATRLRRAVGPPTVPVTLLSLEATRRDADVAVTWVVSDANVEYVEFHILRERTNGVRERITATPLSGKSTYLFNDAAAPSDALEYWLEETGQSGARYLHGPIAVPGAAFEFAVDATPNPFNPSTIVRYTVPQAGHVTVGLYDVEGRLVERLVSGRQQADRYQIRWSPNLATGVYFLQVVVNGKAVTKKLTLLK